MWRKKDFTNLGHFWIRRKAPKRQPLHFILGWYKRPGKLAFDGLLPHDLKRTQASACDRPIFFCISWTDCRIKMTIIYKAMNFNDRAVWRKKGDGSIPLGCAEKIVIPTKAKTLGIDFAGLGCWQTRFF